jgi:hypothetical protein
LGVLGNSLAKFHKILNFPSLPNSNFMQIYLLKAP